MKKFLLFVLSAALLMVGCRKEPLAPQGPQLPEAPADNTLVFLGTVSDLTLGYHLEANQTHQYLFVAGTFAAPEGVLTLACRSALSDGQHPLCDTLSAQLRQGELTYALTTGVVEVTGGRYVVRALTSDSLAMAMAYEGPFTEVGHNGEGSLVYGNSTYELDGAVTSTTPSGNMFMTLLMLTSATTEAEVDLVIVGEEFPEGEYPLGDALTLLSWGVLCDINGETVSSGTLTVAREGTPSSTDEAPRYTFTATGDTPTRSFSFTYTGAVPALR